VLPLVTQVITVTAVGPLGNGQNRRAVPGVDERVVNLNRLAKSARARGVVTNPGPSR
jgi:hypothetical protein